ncbi:hypothetical protein CMV_004316 [Castanea mollissima]|uniref:Uncharacterized protein n=1 Tax=Castanea mollissima TaxID=60419 RepID=A0A8J4RF72_9ROSI|nr:hypothetical protein CMV_004316 [Castanea mollissima]
MCVFGWLVGRSVGDENSVCGKQGGKRPKIRNMEPRIDDEPQVLHPGPLDESLLTRQRYHRSEDIWNGEDPGPLTCRGRTKEMASIQMEDNRYWAWARLPFLCPRIEPPPGCDYGPWPYAPLAFKWVRVPSLKSRPFGMALIHYREQLVRIQSYQVGYGVEIAIRRGAVVAMENRHGVVCVALLLASIGLR